MSTSISALYDRAAPWVVGSDPGLLRLRMATRTTAALACSLAILYLLTRATGQPLTVALLGVVITMIAARSVDEPDPRRQRTTMALLPVPAAASITAATLLSGHTVASDVVFVMVVFAAVYVRRFGARGRALGMVAFMAYFFTLYLRAAPAELPWLVGAVVVGTVCTYVMSSYVLPDRPERVLRSTIRALRARMAIVVDTTAETLRTGRLDERRRRRMRARTVRLNETALLVQTQIEDETNPLWPGFTGPALVPWLFDAELAIEWVATAGGRVAALTPAVPAGIRGELVDALTLLARAIRTPRSGGLPQAADLAQRILDRHCAPAGDDSRDPATTAVRRLALAVINAATATAEVRALIDGVATGMADGMALTGTSAAAGHDPEDEPPADSGEPEEPATGLSPTTRQAIQVSIAASLAIVAGELVSPDRWYWAVIAAFVIFAGTNSWGETLTKGWQRLIGTILGVPAGVLVATLFADNRTGSLAAIFACLFCAFYFMTVTYGLMTFWITTMLALLYGLLGQFSVEVLMLRIEETAIGAVIGVAVAIVVLPTNTRTAIHSDTLAFLQNLSELIEFSSARMCGQIDGVAPSEHARQLDRNLQQFRVTAKPLLAGVAGLAGRRSIGRSLALFTACDRYGRSLARNSERYRSPQDPTGPATSREMTAAFAAAAAQTRSNIDAVVAIIDGTGTVAVNPTTDDLDAAEALGRTGGDGPGSDTRRFLGAVHALRQIDRAVITAATDLGAHEAVTATATAS